MREPQLTIQDFGGVHNGKLDESRARLMKGGSFKRQRTIIIIPAIAPIPGKIVLTWMSMITPPNQGAVRILAEGFEVGDAYSNAIENVLAHPELSQWEYILTLETDNAPPPDGLLLLIEALESHPELAAVGGLYWTKGENGVAQCWGDPNDPSPNFRPQVPQPGKLVECCGLGNGFTLHRMSMFKDKRIERPLFKTVASRTEGVGTQDLHFWGKARKFGYRAAVDCRCLVGHWDDNQKVMW